MTPLRVRHLLPPLGRIPRPGVAEGTSGLVGSALGIARAQAARGYRSELYGWRGPPAGPGPAPPAWTGGWWCLCWR